MITQIVIVRKDRHADLDSFPFRYGFSEIEDFELSIEYDSKPIVQNNGSQQRLRINNAKFNNPITGDIEEGNFVLVRAADEHHYSVVTVIRSDKNVDRTLSKVLQLFRKHEYVTVDDLINYFHPLYMEGKIKTHHDLKSYLIKLNSNNEEKINEIELVLSDAYKKIKELELEKNDTHFKIYNDYANSEEYSRDRAIAQGWGLLYDEAKEYADEFFNEYLNANNNQIEELKNEAGEMPMFLSWTMIEKNMREEYPNSSEEELANIMLGWRTIEKATNLRINKLFDYSKKYPEKTTKELLEKIDLEPLIVSERELEAYKQLQSKGLKVEAIEKLNKDKK